MGEYRSVVNDLNGHVEGSAVQAHSVRDVFMSNPSSTVNNVIKEVRSLNVVATLYRTLASLAALTTIVGARRWGTPLEGMAVVCDALAIPSSWTESPVSWIAEHAGLVGGVAQILLMVGLLALPRPKHLGWDLGQTMEWRGPSTVVLSLALSMQSGHMWPALFLVGLLAALGLWVLSWSQHQYSRSDHVMVAVGSIFLAVVYAPLLVFAWLFARDAGSKPYVLVDS
ncbi:MULTISPECIES: hypothetical protein [unclassified Streptomyces]|uniref:hypothetical protein n=1 Tax=unclassified Streptomyces TaxID=2593676 RepID=UPI0001C1A7CA|nr:MULTISPECIES: hypothetical protein [unclassified Streptomyces]AEN10973.1 hypothetical protein SACTE_3105 [Streptomyces sp. SirexAA-E]MYR65994.1 hypothetical protein [Streptomyces sp. SID4939]MYR98997.1 hypothetical protein [Streptomyces sp. SID4940]MYT63758.1 hypothetical protein [Streptomyces sp. SID8357]MYT86008.1 hypothetical protein [Streptomyces sp. SID8360]